MIDPDERRLPPKEIIVVEDVIFNGDCTIYEWEELHCKGTVTLDGKLTVGCVHFKKDGCIMTGVPS